MIGQWAHALTDTGDTVGTMLLFPWTFHFHFDAWAYAGQTGRMTDAAAYFSGLGGMWDLVWIVYGLFSWRVLTRSYFERHVYTADGSWSFANRAVPMAALLVALPGGLLLRHEPLDRVDDLGARRFTTTRTTCRGAGRTGCTPSIRSAPSRRDSTGFHSASTRIVNDFRLTRFRIAK